MRSYSKMFFTTVFPVSLQILLESDDYRSFVMTLEMVTSDKERNRQGTL